VSARWRGPTLAAALALLGLAFPYLDRVLEPALYRQALLWTLPLLVGAIAWLLAPRPAPHPDPRASLRTGWPYGAAATVAGLIALAAIGIGFERQWVVFTYGDQGLWTDPWKTVVWALPLCLLLGTVGWEFGLRRTLALSFEGRTGWIVSVAVGTALAWPSVAPGGRPPDVDYAWAALAVAVAQETILTALFRRGGLGLAGLGRGATQYFDGFVINDWFAPHFPAANYASSEPAFYALRAALALGALLLFALATRALDRRRANLG
jgi:hypothetical protein